MAPGSAFLALCAAAAAHLAAAEVLAKDVSALGASSTPGLRDPFAELEDEFDVSPPGDKGSAPPQAFEPPAAAVREALPATSANDGRVVRLILALVAMALTFCFLFPAALVAPKRSPAPKEEERNISTSEKLPAKKTNVGSEEAEAFGCTALHRAAHAGEITEARALLGARADPHAREAWDETPLHFAARSGNAEICSLLLDHGAAANPINAQDWTPLLTAAHAGKVAVCELLLDRGAHMGDVSESDLPAVLSGLLAARVLGEGGCFPGQTEQAAVESDSEELVESYWRCADTEPDDATAAENEPDEPEEAEPINVHHWQNVGQGVLSALKEAKAEAEEEMMREEKMQQGNACLVFQ
jgi:hypothetical protein